MSRRYRSSYPSTSKCGNKRARFLRGYRVFPLYRRWLHSKLSDTTDKQRKAEWRKYSWQWLVPNAWEILQERFLAVTNAFEGTRFINPNISTNMTPSDYASQLFPTFTAEQSNAIAMIYENISTLATNIDKAAAIKGECTHESHCQELLNKQLIQPVSYARLTWCYSLSKVPHIRYIYRCTNTGILLTKA